MGSVSNKTKYSSSFPPLTVSLCVGNGNTTQWDRQVSGNTFFLPPNSPLIMMSLHCTTVTLENSLFFYNAIQAPLDIPRRSQEAKPWILSELGVGPQLGSAGTPRSGRWECAEVETTIHFSGTCSHLHLSLTYDPSQPPDPCLLHLLHLQSSIQYVLFSILSYQHVFAKFPLHQCIVVSFHLIPRF